MNELVIMKNKAAVTTSLKIAEVFGKEHRNVLRDIEGVLKNEQTQNLFVKSTYIHEQNKQEYPMYYMNRDGFTLLAMGFTGATAMKFKLNFIHAFNEMEEYIQKEDKTKVVPSKRKDEFELALTGVEYATRILRTDTTSNIKMLEDVHKDFGVNSSYLPKYVDEEVTRSLTSLLKDNGNPMSAVKANNKLIQLGLLEIKERPSSRGTKEFKALTERGLRYGKNLISPKNKTETQPHYYESKFNELLELLK